MKTKQIVFTAPKVAELLSVDCPSPEKNEVTVRLLKGGRLNFKDILCEIHSPADAQTVYDRLVNEKNFPIGVLFDWKRV